MTPPSHLLTVDVEDWPQSTLNHALPIGERVVANTHAVAIVLKVNPYFSKSKAGLRGV